MPPIRSSALKPSADLTSVYLSNVDPVVAQMLQENVSLLARHAGTKAADHRTLLRSEKFNSLRQGLKAAFVISLMPMQPSKHSRKSPTGPSAKAFSGRFTTIALNLNARSEIHSSALHRQTPSARLLSISCG